MNPTGVAPFFVDPDSVSSEHGGLDAVSPAFTGAAANIAVAPFSVPTRRLDTLLPLLMGGGRRTENTRDIHLLKIDTEGHDFRVLRGAANSTLQVRILFIPTYTFVPIFFFFFVNDFCAFFFLFSRAAHTLRCF